MLEFQKGQSLPPTQAMATPSRGDEDQMNLVTSGEVEDDSNEIPHKSTLVEVKDGMPEEDEDEDDFDVSGLFNLADLPTSAEHTNDSEMNHIEADKALYVDMIIIIN